MTCVVAATDRSRLIRTWLDFYRTTSLPSQSARILVIDIEDQVIDSSATRLETICNRFATSRSKCASNPKHRAANYDVVDDCNKSSRVSVRERISPHIPKPIPPPIQSSEVTPAAEQGQQMQSSPPKIIKTSDRRARDTGQPNSKARAHSHTTGCTQSKYQESTKAILFSPL